MNGKSRSLYISKIFQRVNRFENFRNIKRSTFPIQKAKVKKNEKPSKSTNRQTKIVLQAFPLPDQVRLFLEENQDILSLINGKKLAALEISKFKSKLMNVFKKTDFPKPAQLVDSIIMLGPNGCGPNILGKRDEI